MYIDFITILIPFKAAFDILAEWWWVVIPAYLVFLYSEVWVDYFQKRTTESVNWKNLLISVPKEFTRGPEVMEQFFASMWSLYAPPNLIDTVFKGEKQNFLSFELVGIDGNVRFIVHTPDIFQDHVEAQIYAQYPEAEIQEIDDYTELIPDDFLDKGYDLWGTEFEFTNKESDELKNMFPIRTYHVFEHQFSGVSTDPMAAITEFLSRLKKGEQVWFQILTRPASPGWGKIGQKFVQSVVDKYKWDKDSGGGGMMPPTDQDIIKAVSSKIERQGFECKFRFVYVGKKEVFQKSYGVTGAIGPIQQFCSNVMNGVKPNKSVTTSIDYFFPDMRVKFRKKALFRAMKKRDFEFGSAFLVFNPEELATLWHFPEPQVKAERVEKIRAKKSGAPAGLPVEPKPTDIKV